MRAERAGRLVVPDGLPGGAAAILAPWRIGRRDHRAAADLGGARRAHARRGGDGECPHRHRTRSGAAALRPPLGLRLARRSRGPARPSARRARSARHPDRGDRALARTLGCRGAPRRAGGGGERPAHAGERAPLSGAGPALPPGGGADRGDRGAVGRRPPAFRRDRRPPRDGGGPRIEQVRRGAVGSAALAAGVDRRPSGARRRQHARGRRSAPRRDPRRAQAACAPDVDPFLVVAPRHLDRAPAALGVFQTGGFRSSLRSGEPRPLAEHIPSAAERGDRSRRPRHASASSRAPTSWVWRRSSAAGSMGPAATTCSSRRAAGGRSPSAPASARRPAKGRSSSPPAVGSPPPPIRRALAASARTLGARSRKARARRADGARAAVGAERGAAARIADFVVAVLGASRGARSGGPAR